MPSTHETVHRAGPRLSQTAVGHPRGSGPTTATGGTDDADL